MKNKDRDSWYTKLEVSAPILPAVKSLSLKTKLALDIAVAIHSPYQIWGCATIGTILGTSETLVKDLFLKETK